MPKLKSKPRKYIEEPEPVSMKNPIVLHKPKTADISTDAEEVKVYTVEEEKDSKFKRRFMNRLPKNSGKVEDAGEYQWVHKPTVEIDMGHIQPLFLQLQKWVENLKELLFRLGKYKFYSEIISKLFSFYILWMGITLKYR